MKVQSATTHEYIYSTLTWLDDSLISFYVTRCQHDNGYIDDRSQI